MRNTHNTQFSFDTFKAAYDSDPRIKALVKNFDKEKIQLKQSEMDDVTGSEPAADNTVSSMAKRATDVGATL
jgi:hypothetical protein